jgi:SAM-dependent methyltransferase
VWLAERGVYVTAIDASSAMVDRARHKAERTGTADHIDVHHLDLQALPLLVERRGQAQIFDGALANFGVLNCLAEPRRFAAALAPLVRRGGHVAVVVMGQWCPWELVGFLARGRCREAFRRFRQGGDAHVSNRDAVRVWYPSPRRLRADFAPSFRAVHCAGIGIFLPPTDFRGLVDRWPRLFALAAAVDRRVSTTFPATWLNDHYLMVFERC